MTDSFPPEVTAKLKTYVYRLIDPRNGGTFYVGKGVGDYETSNEEVLLEFKGVVELTNVHL